MKINRHLFIRIGAIILFFIGLQSAAFSQPDTAIWNRLIAQIDSCSGLCTQCQIEGYNAAGKEYIKIIDTYYRLIVARFNVQINASKQEMDSFLILASSKKYWKKISRSDAIAEAKRNLINAQKYWLLYQKNSNQFIEQYYFNYDRGSVYYTQGAYRSLIINQFRAYELKRYYEIIEREY